MKLFCASNKHSLTFRAWKQRSINLIRLFRCSARDTSKKICANLCNLWIPFLIRVIRVPHFSPSPPALPVRRPALSRFRPLEACARV